MGCLSVKHLGDMSAELGVHPVALLNAIYGASEEFLGGDAESMCELP